jgi:hypothetical protein
MSNDLIGYAPGACLRAAWAFSQFFIPWQGVTEKSEPPGTVINEGRSQPFSLVAVFF